MSGEVCYGESVSDLKHLQMEIESRQFCSEYDNMEEAAECAIQKSFA